MTSAVDSKSPKEVKDIDEELADFSLLKKKKKKKPIAPKKEEKSTSNDEDYTYTELLERIFEILKANNPSLQTRKRFTLPPPSIIRIGTRKTMWENFPTISELMHRPMEHVMAFFLAELGTEGSIDNRNRFIIRGRYVPKQIESLLKRYIAEYVHCSMCRGADTILSRDPITRLYFVKCEMCSSHRSVPLIKSGFHATTRDERREKRM